jgi:hypothetical protein
MTDYFCEKCNKSFYDKSTLNKHIKNDVCEKKKLKMGCEICERVFAKKSNLERHLLTKKHLANVNNFNNEIKLKGYQNINGNNNTITNINAPINNMNIINVVPFSEEVLDGLSAKDKESILKKCYMSLNELVMKLHLNPKLPEYHNVYISNIKSKYGHVYDGKKWILKNVNSLLDDLISKKKDDIEDLLSEYEDKLPEKIIGKVRDMIGMIDYDPSDDDVIDKKKVAFKKNVIDEIKLLLYNYKDIPLKTKENNENNEKIKK